MAIALERIAEEAEQRTGRLSLRNLGLEWLPKELFALTHLRELDLGADSWRSSNGNKISAQQHRFSSFGLLRTLKISVSDIVDLVLLSGLSGLQELDCSGTSVSDLSPLSGLRVCLERLFPGEAPEHQTDHSDADEGNGGAEVLLVVAYEAAAAREP
ncbi:hypothetical protein [Azospirillum largimobile]